MLQWLRQVEEVECHRYETSLGYVLSKKKKKSSSFAALWGFACAITILERYSQEIRRSRVTLRGFCPLGADLSPAPPQLSDPKVGWHAI